LNETNNEAVDLPKGVEHLYGSLYSVPLKDIKFAEGGFGAEDSVLVFKNTRHALAGMKVLGRGLDKDSMKILRDSIKIQGIHNLPLCRWHEGGVQCVEGERRLRSVNKLFNENIDCYDKKTGNIVPAKELYKKITVQIEEMDDKTAYKTSLAASEMSEGFGEGARVAFIAYLRRCNLPDSDILDITGYGVEWLKLTDKLSKLDEKTFAALASEEINRAVALKLLGISDLKERHKKLNKFLETANERWFATQAALEEKAEQLGEIAEVAESNAEDNGSEEEKSKAQKAKERAATAAAQAQKHANTKPKATPKDDDSPVPKPLTAVKLTKFWLEPVKEIVKNNCVDEKGQDLQIDPEDARLAKTLCEYFIKGEVDIAKILKSHAKNKARRSN
jgi:hypothetical protein